MPDAVTELIERTLEDVVVLNRSDPLFANTEKLARIADEAMGVPCQMVPESACGRPFRGSEPLYCSVCAFKNRARAIAEEE